MVPGLVSNVVGKNGADPYFSFSNLHLPTPNFFFIGPISTIWQSSLSCPKLFIILIRSITLIRVQHYILTITYHLFSKKPPNLPRNRYRWYAKGFPVRRNGMWIPEFPSTRGACQKHCEWNYEIMMFSSFMPGAIPQWNYKMNTAFLTLRMQ